MLPIAGLLAIVVVGVPTYVCAHSNSASTVEEMIMDIRTERATRPVELTDAEIEAVHGGKIEPVLTNPGGNEPQGGGAENGNAITSTNENPAGHAPPGQNP